MPPMLRALGALLLALPWTLLVCAECVECDDPALLQRVARPTPQQWKTPRDLATISRSWRMRWGSSQLRFLSAIPTFGADGNYIALLHQYGPRLWKRSKVESLWCSGPSRSHRSQVRVKGARPPNRKGGKIMLVFLCDWPVADSKSERFKVFLQDAHGKEIGSVVAHQKLGMLKQYRTIGCLRDVWPSKTAGLKLLPEWMEFMFMHGLEHLLIYTTNKNSERLVDLYEPYLKSGLVSRIHLDYNFSALKPKRRGLHNLIAGDCIFRAKNHATWVIPTMDVDEFFVVKDSSIFGGHIPQDYMSSTWDAVVKSKGLEVGQVHSISFKRYLFKAAPLDKVQLTSTLRQAHCRGDPKYVFNVKVVDAIFIHDVVTVRNGTKPIKLKPWEAVVHHYNPESKSWVPPPIDTKDTSLLWDAPKLEQALQKRFGQQSLGNFLTDLAKVAPLSPQDDDNVEEVVEKSIYWNQS